MKLHTRLTIRYFLSNGTGWLDETRSWKPLGLINICKAWAGGKHLCEVSGCIHSSLRRNGYQFRGMKNQEDLWLIREGNLAPHCSAVSFLLHGFAPCPSIPKLMELNWGSRPTAFTT